MEVLDSLRNNRAIDGIASTADAVRRSTVGQFIIDVLLWMRSSVLNFIISLGVALFVIGLLIPDGVVAAMMVVWGVSAILFALLGYACMKAIGYI